MMLCWGATKNVFEEYRLCFLFNLLLMMSSKHLICIIRMNYTNRESINKCSHRSMEVKLPVLLGNYDRQTDRSTIQPISQNNQPTDRHEWSLQISYF